MFLGMNSKTGGGRWEMVSIHGEWSDEKTGSDILNDIRDLKKSLEEKSVNIFSDLEPMRAHCLTNNED